ncbi:MAG: GNAT family N-acetyltransferase [Alphaproteobacteria bacterium]|nr:GNAT family N-acetyltransferase [Alphaproteobacteria bacterium]
MAELGWKQGLTAHENTEADNFDKPGTRYLVSRCEHDGRILGVTRLFPTVDELTEPGTIGQFMISESFRSLVTTELPSGPKIYEASRLVVHPRLRDDRDRRRAVVNELIVGYMEYALYKRLDAYVALMNPHYWKVFERPGWEVDYLGPETDIGGEVVRVGRLWVNEEINRTIRESTGLLDPVLDFGRTPDAIEQEIEQRALGYSPLLRQKIRENEVRKVA